jgi:hypothetical protein
MIQAGQSRVQIPARAKRVQSSPEMSRPALWLNQPPFHWIPEVKWLPCMNDHSLHSGAKVMKRLDYTSTSPPFDGAHGENFTFMGAEH